METDERILWVRQRVCLGLNIVPSLYDDLVRRDDGVVGQTIVDFFGDAGQHPCLLFYMDGPVLEVSVEHLPDTDVLATYFLRYDAKTQLNPQSSTWEEDVASEIEFGVLDGHPLLDLSSLIQEVYNPIFVTSMATQQPMSATLRQEFHSRNFLLLFYVCSLFLYFLVVCAELKKFSKQLSSATQQLKGDARLAIPNINITDPSAVVDDFDVHTRCCFFVLRVGCLLTYCGSW